jgi:hypothetical protein
MFGAFSHAIEGEQDMVPTLVPSEAHDPAWQQLDEIAEALERGDSLRELIAALVAARRAFSSRPQGNADDRRHVVSGFINAVLAAVVWERLGLDATNPQTAAARLRHVGASRPAEPRLSTSPMTLDEIAAVEILAQDTTGV